MREIDCFLIGHNEIPIGRSRRMIQYLFGKSSHEYKDRVKYNLSQLIVNDKRYTPVEYFNHVNRHWRDGPEDMNIITESFSLAIACLGSYLHTHGCTFDFINSFQDQQEYLKLKLLRKEILTVGIITTYYLSHQPIHEIIGFIRKYDPDVRIVVGGPYVINRVNGMAEDKLIPLLDSIAADFYVNDSSGEDILLDLIRAIKAADGRYDAIRNLFSKKGDHFGLSFTKTVAYNFQHNDIDWKLFTDRLPSVVNVRTAVSCPFRCSFCNFPSYAGEYILSSLGQCEKELRHLYELGIRYIQFVDDTFNVPKNRFKELLRMMIRNKFNFHWNSYFKCQYADEEVISLMKDSGCQFVFLGIESGSQVILDNMNKKNQVEVYRECIRLFNRYDIMTMCSVIVGFPGETADTFEETFQFIEENQPTFYQQRLWWYDHASPIHQHREKFGITGEGYHWQHQTMNSDQAHELADRLFLHIGHSIHITEYVLPFFLLTRQLQKQQVLRYLRNYMYANREQYLYPGGQSSMAYVDSLIGSITDGLDAKHPHLSP